MLKIKKHFFFPVFLLLASFSFTNAQITFTVQPATNLVQDVLVGAGVQVSNITSGGDTAQIGRFTGGNLVNLGVNNGVVMTTGNLITQSDATDISFIGQAANNGTISSASDNTTDLTDDADLNAIISSYGATAITNNLAVLEFDFIPSGDSVAFNYVFASEEYNGFVCSQYFDVFGFFISGPGFNGPFSNNAENIAIVPGSSPVLPVSMNTINSGVSDGGDFCPPNGLNNSQFFVDNSASTNFGPYGFTTILTAQATVQCGQTYHIKLILANGFDTAFDSWVFLQAESFSSSVPNFTATNLLPDSSVIEGCLSGNLVFTRNITDEELSIPMNYSGTATFGDDYTGLPDTITFPVGVDSLFFTLVPVNDGITEGTEIVIFTFNVPNECGDTVTVSDYLKIKDPYELSITTPDPVLDCPDPNYTVGVQVSGGYQPYSYSWDYNNLITPTINIPISKTDTFIVQIHDVLNCILNQYTDTVIVTLNYDSLQTASQSRTICKGQTTLLSPLAQFGLAPFTYEWVNITNTDTTTVYPSDTTAYVYIVTDACNISSQDTFFVNVPDYDDLIVTVTDTTICKRGTAELYCSVTGGDGNYTYYWSGPPVIVPITDSTSSASPEASVIYWIDVYDGCNTVSSDTMHVDVQSCELQVGNAFSPNSDGKNDFFEINNILFYPNNTVFLYNRWGKKVLEQSSYKNNWAGDDSVTSGTYYYVVDPGDGTELLKGYVTIFKN